VSIVAIIPPFLAITDLVLERRQRSGAKTTSQRRVQSAIVGRPERRSSNFASLDVENPDCEHLDAREQRLSRRD
jgi:hypothetical protein